MEALLISAAGGLITADGQLEYKGYLLGDDETTFMTQITGWDDLPGVDSGNALRANAHGGWAGKKLAGQRIITWEGRFSPALPGLWAEKLKELRSALTLPRGTEEEPIVIRSHDETKLVFGAVVQRAIPMDRSYGYYGAKLSVQFECSDPRKYSLGENVWNLELPPQIDVGLTYPLTYPLDYGVEVTSSIGSLFNDGDVTTPVELVFNGPVVNPALISMTSNTRLEFQITLDADETLVVNTRTGTVMLNGVADRLYTRTPTSAPLLSFGLEPGWNDLMLTAADWEDGGAVTITWRDATL